MCEQTDANALRPSETTPAANDKRPDPVAADQQNPNEAADPIAKAMSYEEIVALLHGWGIRFYEDRYEDVGPAPRFSADDSSALDSSDHDGLRILTIPIIDDSHTKYGEQKPDGLDAAVRHDYWRQLTEGWLEDFRRAERMIGLLHGNASPVADRERLRVILGLASFFFELRHNAK